MAIFLSVKSMIRLAFDSTKGSESEYLKERSRRRPSGKVKDAQREILIGEERGAKSTPYPGTFVEQ